jgi:hypothetical protein
VTGITGCGADAASLLARTSCKTLAIPKSNMLPKIIENYTRIGVDVGRIVHRILSHLPPDILNGFNEVRLLDNHNHAFACYKKNEAAIEIYIGELLGDFPPIFLKLFYPFTYMVVGMAVGHELDHHVNRNKHAIDREASAERNIMKYVYPSLGLFKPAVRVVSFCCLPFRRIGKKQITNIKNG